MSIENIFRKDIDSIEKETKVTQTIDNYNIMDNPLKLQVWTANSGVEHTGWIISESNNSCEKTHGLQSDLINVYFSTLPYLEHKILTGVEIVTDINLLDGGGIFNGVYPIVNSIGVGDGTYFYSINQSEDKTVTSSTPITENLSQVKFGGSTSLWGYSNGGLDSIIKNGNFTIQFNVDLSSTGKSIEFKNTYIKFYFSNFFESESKAVANRLDLIQYSFLNTSNSLFTLNIEDGYLYEEYYSADVPTFTIQDKMLIAEGNNIPDLKFDSSTGILYVGSPEECTIDFIGEGGKVATDVTFGIKFTNASGLPVQGESVKITYTDQATPSDYVTDSQGEVLITDTFISPLTVDVNVEFKGDDNFNAKTITGKLTITEG